MPTLTTPILQPIIGAAKEGPSLAGYHKIVDYMRCPQEYKFNHVLGIQPKDKEEKKALAVGVLTHIGRAHWFGSQFKATIDQCTAAITRAVQEKATPTNVEAEREAIRLVQAYIEHWRSKPLPLCRAVEYDIGPAPMKPGDTFFQYRTARFDDLSNYPDALNKLCIGDLKTTSDSISGCMNEYRQHGQFILYSILYRMAKEGLPIFGPVAGIMIDIETKEPVPKFHRELITVSTFQERWYTASMQEYLRDAAAMTPTTVARRNPTACARAIGRKGSYACDFRPLCQYGGSHNGQYVHKANGETPKRELLEI